MKKVGVDVRIAMKCSTSIDSETAIQDKLTGSKSVID